MIPNANTPQGSSNFEEIDLGPNSRNPIGENHQPNTSVNSSAEHSIVVDSTSSAHHKSPPASNQDNITFSSQITHVGVADSPENLEERKQKLIKEWDKKRSEIIKKYDSYCYQTGMALAVWPQYQCHADICRYTILILDYISISKSAYQRDMRWRGTPQGVLNWIEPLTKEVVENCEQIQKFVLDHFKEQLDSNSCPLLSYKELALQLTLFQSSQPFIDHSSDKTSEILSKIKTILASCTERISHQPAEKEKWLTQAHHCLRYYFSKLSQPPLREVSLQLNWNPQDQLSWLLLLERANSYYNDAKQAHDDGHFELGNAYLRLGDDEFELAKEDRNPTPPGFIQSIKTWWNGEEPRKFLAKKADLSDDIVSAFKNGDSNLAATLQKLYEDLFIKQSLSTTHYSDQVIKIKKYHGMLKEMQQMLANLEALAPIEGDQEKTKDTQQKIIETKHFIKMSISYCEEEVLEKIINSPFTDIEQKEKEFLRRFEVIENNYNYIFAEKIAVSV